MLVMTFVLYLLSTSIHPCDNQSTVSPSTPVTAVEQLLSRWGRWWFSASKGGRMLPDAWCPRGEGRLNSSSGWCDTQLCSRLYVTHSYAVGYIFQRSHPKTLPVYAGKHCCYFSTIVQKPPGRAGSQAEQQRDTSAVSGWPYLCGSRARLLLGAGPTHLVEGLHDVPCDNLVGGPTALCHLLQSCTKVYIALWAISQAEKFPESHR